MKKLSVIVSLLLVAVLSLGMFGCSSYPSLKKAFEKEDYTVSETVENLTKDIKAAAEKEKLGIETHAMVKGLTEVAFILEFKATDDMKKFYDDNKVVRDAISGITSNEDAQEFYKSLEEKGFAKGNCLVIPIVDAAGEIPSIVKNA